MTSAEVVDRLDAGMDSNVRSITIEFNSHLSDDSYQDYLDEVVEAIEQISCDYAAAADNDTYEVKIYDNRVCGG